MGKKTYARAAAILLLVCVCLAGIPVLTLYNKKSASVTTSQPEESSVSRALPAPFYEVSESLPDIEAPVGFNWRQYEGVTLNFLVENNINANILTKESQAFTKITGITINIRPMDFNTLIEKINMDFIAKTGKFQLVYVDPYQTLNRFAASFEDLYRYNGDPALPHIPGGLEDFFQEQVQVDSYFMDTSALHAIPFDTTTMIFYYRKDIFEKYKVRFQKEKGYDWTPGQPGFTWERYSEIARWIDENVPDSEVRYGSGHMAQEHNSVFCDFSNVLAAYGGDYFKDPDVGTLGLKEPREINVMSPDFIKALTMYKRIIGSAAPKSLDWDWYDTAEAFKNGDIAMMANWDENAASIENPVTSRVAGKVGYSILPYGPRRSANIYGGSGIGINRDADETEKLAAWLFIVWATSPQTQLLVMKHPEGGGIPPRKSIYQDAYVKAAVSGRTSNAMHELPAVLDAWKKENAYYRPKIGNFYSVEQIIIRNLHEMLRNNRKAEDTAKRIHDQIKALGGE